MVKIRLKTTLAGPKLTAIAGSVIEVEEVFAKELLAGGYAEPVMDEIPFLGEAKAAKVKIERAVLKAPERTVGIADEREEDKP